MNEPKLRFKGFEGEWESISIEEVSPLQGGFAFQSTSFRKYGIPIVRISNILNTGEIGGAFIFYKGVVPSQYSLSQGDAVIAMSGATTGKTAVVKDNGFYYLNQRVGKFARTGKIYYPFVATYIQSYYFVSKLQNLLSSSAQPNISTSDVNSIQINVPTDKAEQRKIATYFTHLDTLIEASRQKVEKLKQVKAASLQSLFPTHGQRTPKIRFKGFEGEWKVVKLGEMYERRNERNDLTYGVDKIISVANMYFRGDSVVSSIDYLRSYNIFKLGDIAFEGNKSKNFAHGRFVENSIGDGIVSHVFVVLKRKDSAYDLNFWKYYINNERIMGPILGRCTKASTMMNDIVVDDFLKESVLVPSLEEQQKIGKYLSTLDTLLTLERQRYAKLQQVKRASLSQMLV